MSDNIKDITFTLQTDEGGVKCRVYDTFTHNDRMYIALVPLLDDGTDGKFDEIQLFEFEETDDGIELLTIDIDDFDDVLDTFNELQQERE